METNEPVNETLNDLIMINNDRIAEYETALGGTQNLDIDLRALFEGMIQQSKQHKEELAKIIRENGGEVEDDTTSSGKIYRAWMDVKASITENDRVSILSSCEFGEDAVQRAYSSALASHVQLDADTHKILEEQQNALLKSHEIIKKQSDAYKQLQKSA